MDAPRLSRLLAGSLLAGALLGTPARAATGGAGEPPADAGPREQVVDEQTGSRTIQMLLELQESGKAAEDARAERSQLPSRPASAAQPQQPPRPGADEEQDLNPFVHGPDAGMAPVAQGTRTDAAVPEPQPGAAIDAVAAPRPVRAAPADAGGRSVFAFLRENRMALVAGGAIVLLLLGLGAALAPRR